jgi:hypothetical protein
MEEKGLDLVGFKKQFDELMQQNERLEWIKKKYVEHAKEIIDIKQDLISLIERLDKVAHEIDPVLGGTFEKRKNIKIKEIINELYDKMKNGVQVTRLLVHSTYPDLIDKQGNYIMEALKKLPGIKQAKDGRALRLYLE